MARYAARRFIQSIIVLIGVSIVVFWISRLGGDPVGLLLSPDVQVEERVALRKQLGLDAPIYIQYLRFLNRAVRGDFGQSILAGVPAMSLVLERLPATAQLAIFTVIFAIVTGIILGVLSAIKHNSLFDYLGMLTTFLAQSVPSFWLGILFIMFFGLRLRILPISGRGSFSHVIMPGVTLSTGLVAAIARLTRTSMLEVLDADYIRTARAKGLSERIVTTRHALRNALIPVVTVVGMSLAGLLSGAVITEQIFAWPGVGRLAINSIYQRDFPVVQAVVFFVSAVVVAINFVVDVAYTFLDPRIRYD